MVLQCANIIKSIGQCFTRREHVLFKTQENFLFCAKVKHNYLGAYGFSNMDVFLEKFQTAFDPPPPRPSFSENHNADFFRNS